MYEAGVPVDIVAGVSIGAFIGGIYCGTQQPDTVSKRAKGWFMVRFLDLLFDLFNIFSIWHHFGRNWLIWLIIIRQFSRVCCTFEHFLFCLGSTFNAGIRDVFETREIDDLWIPYFCVSTDISMHQVSSVCLVQWLSRWRAGSYLDYFFRCACTRRAVYGITFWLQCRSLDICRRCAIRLVRFY